MRLNWWISVGSVASLALFWMTDIPLGVPSDDFGTWNRHNYSADGETASLLINIGAAVVMAGVYVAVAWLGQRKIDSIGRGGRILCLSLLVVAGFFWLSALQRCTPVIYGSVKPNWVLYDKGSAGYFIESVTSDKSTGEFLAGYEDELAKGNVLHIGTHPPGLFLLNRALLSMCAASSEFSTFVLKTQPSDMAESFRTIEAGARLAPELKQYQRAALWLSVLLTQFTAAATVVAIYWLIRSAEVVRIRSAFNLPGDAVPGIEEDSATSPATAWMAAALWPLVPSIAVFLPKSDALFPLLFTLVLPVWLTALHRRSHLLAGMTGLLIWANAVLSLAVIPVFVVLILATLMLFRFQWQDLYQRFNLSCILPMVLVFAACCIAFWVATGVDLANVWALNIKNHAGFYDQFHRTRWKWMLINPLELTMSVGAPIMILALAGVFRSRKHIVAGWRRGSIRPVLFQAAIATWLLLWLSGKNNGEAARLWLFLMPWVLWVASGALTGRGATQPKPKLEREWLSVLGFQVLVAIGTVSRIAGFHFGM